MKFCCVLPISLEFHEKWYVACKIVCVKILHILKTRERTLGCQEKLEGKEQKVRRHETLMSLVRSTNHAFCLCLRSPTFSFLLPSFLLSTYFSVPFCSFGCVFCRVGCRTFEVLLRFVLKYSLIYGLTSYLKFCYVLC
ncbi:hypothetical protein S83_064136 [Arachis hypogaea]